MNLDSEHSPFEETHFATVRNKERQHLLGEVRWRITEKGQDVKDINFRSLTPDEQEKFANSSNSHEIQPYVVGDKWATEHYVLGDYALRSIRGQFVVGYLGFCVLNSGDALITEVIGMKGQPFTKERSSALIETALNFLKSIAMERAFIVNGKILNDLKEKPRESLNDVYEKLAKDNGFDQEIWWLKYVKLDPSKIESKTMN